MSFWLVHAQQDHRTTTTSMVQQARREQHAKRRVHILVVARAKLSCRQGEAGSLEDTKREDTVLCFVSPTIRLYCR